MFSTLELYAGNSLHAVLHLGSYGAFPYESIEIKFISPKSCLLRSAEPVSCRPYGFMGLLGSQGLGLVLSYLEPGIAIGIPDVVCSCIDAFLA